METDAPLLSPAQAIRSIWWVVLLRGFALLGIGLYALLSPGITLLAWAFVLGLFLLADGVLGIVAGIGGWTESRGWTIARGVLSLLVGGFAVGHPALFGVLAGLTVIVALAGWAFVGGILEIVVAIRERKAIEGEGWMILNGVFSVLFGLVLVLAPLLSLSIFIRVSGVFAILFGIVACWMAFRIRKLGKA